MQGENDLTRLIQTKENTLKQNKFCRWETSVGRHMLGIRNRGNELEMLQ